MRLEWNQRQNLVKILNYLHINFQKQILKGQLSINRRKSRSLAHNNFSAVLFFILKSILVLFLGSILCAYLSLSTFICLSNDPAYWPERWKLPRQRIDVCTTSHLRSSSRSTSRTCKETERRRCGRSHSNAQVSDRITKY